MRRAGLFGALLGALVLASPSVFAAGRVVVLDTRASEDFAWPSGQRAVIAELVASDAELVIRPALAVGTEALEREVVDAAQEPDTVGAVGVGREGALGFALVAVHAGRSAVRVESDVQEGPVADGAVALRVSEILKVRTFALPPEVKRQSPARRPARPPPANDASATVWPWLGVGAAGTRGASSAVPAVAVGLRVPLARWWSLEPSGTFTLGGLRVGTSAGEVMLSERRATLELLFGPTARRGLSAGAGAGGGIAWVSGKPRAAGGYIGTERSTEVSVLALRGFGAWQGRSLRLLAFVEGSLLVPPVTIHDKDDELARLGQPWLLGGIALGYSP